VAEAGKTATPLNTPVEMDLAALVSGDVAMRKMAISEEAKAGEVELEQTKARYIPGPDFAGVDDFVYEVEFEDGRKRQNRVTITVEKGAVPTLDNMTMTGMAGEEIRFDVVGHSQNGPVLSIELVGAPEVGSSYLDGGDVVFRSPVDFVGEAATEITVTNAWGASERARLVAKVVAAPIAGTEQSVSMWAGKPVTVDLTAGARGGPFVGAAILSLTPADAVSVQVKAEGGRQLATFTPIGAFDGNVVATFSLANAAGTSAPARVLIEVRERPNPARDAEVLGQLDAQAREAREAAGAQISNVIRRLESLREGNGKGRAFGISLIGDTDRGPGYDPVREQIADELRKATAPTGRQALADPMTAAPSLESSPVNVWVGGAIELGKRRDQSRAGFKFATSGLSGGVDTALTSKLTIGAGVGYGQDTSKVGENGTKSESRNVAVFGYGSYHPSRATFVDGVFGVGRLDFDAQRYVTETGGMVESQRQGSQIFGALSVGYEHRGPRLYVSPYGRIEFSYSDLNAFTETGDDTFALRFAKQKVKDLEAVIGLRSSYLFEMENGDLLPNLRLEYRKQLQSPGTATIAYSDWAASPSYTAKLADYDASALVVGLGAEWKAISGWTGFVEGETSIFNGKGHTVRLRAGGTTKF